MEAVLESLSAGVPVLLLHFLVTITMLAVGVTIYLWMTPYPELKLIREGNTAAAISLGAAILSLAVPLALSMSVSVGVIGPAVLLASVKLGVAAITAAAVSG
ncbi:MAG: DUF350 domain-containing protein [Rickettsiales bacterium]